MTFSVPQKAQTGSTKDAHIEIPRPTQKSRGRPTTGVSEENMARLVHIAFKHFVEFGPKNANIQAIADEVGVSRQTIYLKFGTKENFFSEIIANREISFFAQLPIDLETDERPAQIVLEEYGRNTVNFLLSEDRIQLARVMFGGLHRYPHLIESEREAYINTFQLLGRYIDRVARRSGVDLEDCSMVARNFTAQLIGIQLPVVLGTGKVPTAAHRQKWVRTIVKVMLTGLNLK
jgi:AcrR family transcriptional regulator